MFGAAAMLVAGEAHAQDAPLAPSITAISPAKRMPGELVSVAGANLGAGTRVHFISTGAKATRVRGLAVWDDRTLRLRVAIPRLARGRYKVEVVTRVGTAVGTPLLTVVDAPRGGPAPAALNAKLAAMFKHHGETGWIPAAVARALATDAEAGKLASVQDALEAEEAAAIADAEKTTGPIAPGLILLAYKAGRPIKDVAMEWRHCHASRTGASGKPETVAGEGQVLQLDPSCGPGSRPHAHVVAKMDSSLANRDVFLAAEGGRKPPPRLLPHVHTELRFDDGQVYTSPSDAEQGEWYDGLGPLIDVVRWTDVHAPAMRGRHVISLGAACNVIACTTYQPSCPMAVAHATDVALKEAAIMLIMDGAVSPSPPAPRAGALARLADIKP